MKACVYEFIMTFRKLCHFSKNIPWTQIPADSEQDGVGKINAVLLYYSVSWYVIENSSV